MDEVKYLYIGKTAIKHFFYEHKLNFYLPKRFPYLTVNIYYFFLS